jgi:Zn-finger nucleic acid-binding protein
MTCPNCRSVNVEDHTEFGMTRYRCLRCGWIWFDITGRDKGFYGRLSDDNGNLNHQMGAF